MPRSRRDRRSDDAAAKGKRHRSWRVYCLTTVAVCTALYRSQACCLVSISAYASVFLSVVNGLLYTTGWTRTETIVRVRAPDATSRAELLPVRRGVSRAQRALEEVRRLRLGHTRGRRVEGRRAAAAGRAGGDTRGGDLELGRDAGAGDAVLSARGGEVLSKSSKSWAGAGAGACFASRLDDARRRDAAPRVRAWMRVAARSR